MEFNYKARTKDGGLETGEVSAATRTAAVADLRSRGLTPVSIVEKSAGSGSFSVFSLIRRVTLLEKLTFVRNLAVMIRSGVSVPRALKILSIQTNNRKFQEIILDLAKNVERGLSLSQGFAKHPEIFSGLYVSLTEVGEASGNLDANLDYLAILLSREHDLVRKTKGALTYPFVVLATLAVVGVLMFVFVLPKLIESFKELNAELPPVTKFLIAGVDLFSQHSALAIVSLIGFISALVVFFRTASGKDLAMRAAIFLPVLSGITKKVNLARFTLTLGMLLKSSMQIVPAMAIVGKSLGNKFYSSAALDAGNQVRVGVSLSSALEKHSNLFPPLLTLMLKVGEEAGTVEDILKQMGEYYEEEVDSVMKNISSIIEPVMVVIIGTVVGVMAVALIMPIYSITQAM